MRPKAFKEEGKGRGEGHGVKGNRPCMEERGGDSPPLPNSLVLPPACGGPVAVQAHDESELLALCGGCDGHLAASLRLLKLMGAVIHLRDRVGSLLLGIGWDRVWTGWDRASRERRP